MKNKKATGLNLTSIGGTISKILILLYLVILPIGISLKAQSLSIKNIIFEGNNNLKSSVLEGIIKTKKKQDFDSKLIRFDKILLTNFYRQNGFLDIWIEPTINRRGEDVDIIYQIKEGKQYLLESINISGGILISDSDLRQSFKIKDGDIYQRQEIENGLNTIENWYYNHGKPYVTFSEKEIKNDSLISVDIIVQENETVNITDIQYSGLNKVRRYIVRRELEVEKGDIYSREKIEKSQKNIYSTGLFDFVGLELEANDTLRSNARLLVNVIEKKPRWVGLKFGVAYEQATIYGGTFDFTFEFGHRNLFGSSRTIYLNIIPSISYDFEKNDIINPKNQFSVTYVEPWIGFTRTPGVLQAAYFQVRPLHAADYNYFTSSFAVKHQFSDSRIISGTLAFDQVKILEGDTLGQSFFAQTQGQDFIYSITSGYSRDTRDNYLHPQYGSVTTATIKLAYARSRDQNTDQTTTNRFLKIVLTWNRYQKNPFNKKWILASRVKAGNIMELGKRTIVPRTERFYLGGASSVRGYPEQLLGPTTYDENTDRRKAVGGRFLLLTNIELRIPLLWLIWGEIFFDAGNVYQHYQNFFLSTIKTTSGIGLALITPMGPVRIDYGWKHRPEKFESKGELHLAISFAF